MHNAVLVAVGDELLGGVRSDKDCAFLAWHLNDAGVSVKRIEMVSDELESIKSALERWVGRTDLLVMSGGLGPTHDDKTRYAIAEYLQCGMSVNNELYDRVVARFDGNFKELIEKSRPIQGLVPTAARAVYNPAGSALGIAFEREGTRVWSFPGVPFEFEAMVRQEILPLLPSGHHRDAISIAGIPETLVVERIPDVIAEKRLHISVLPSYNLVELVISGEVALVGEAVKTVRARFSAEECLPEGCVTLPEAVLKTGLQGATLACAESCTGGMIGSALTDLPGVSQVFMGSAVVYSNEAKMKVLGVPAAVLDQHGAVSGECAEAMALGALKVYGTSAAVSVTGVAGPDGGTVEKPVGTVWFGTAVMGKNGPRSSSFVKHLGGHAGGVVRSLVRERAVTVALISAWRQMREFLLQ